MQRRTLDTLVAFFFAAALIGCSSTPAVVSTTLDAEPLMVFLARHGEKVDGGRDPELSAAGNKRAVTLAHALRSAEIEYVHSSDYIRTRNTAAPIAAKLGLEVELYDPRDLPTLIENLHSIGGRHLVVGHSNTTPHVVELLGGQPGSPIDEKSEYDRLYIVTVSETGEVNSVMLRYGSPYDPE